MENDNYDLIQLKKDMKELKVENRIQTVAVLVLFFFGISTIYDLTRNK